MNNYKKYSGIFILVVFLTAQLGEPMHYLWVNHVSFETSAPGNEIKAPVVTHACSQFHLLKNRMFLATGHCEARLAIANGPGVLLPFFYLKHFVKEVPPVYSVRGPPLLTI